MEVSDRKTKWHKKQKVKSSWNESKVQLACEPAIHSYHFTTYVLKSRRHPPDLL